MNEHAPTQPFVVVNGDKVVLRGWRNLSLLNVVATLCSIAAPFVAYWLVGWWLAIPAAAWLAYALWTLYRSALTEISFGLREVTIHGETFAASDLVSFEARQFDDEHGMDDALGRTEVWVTIRGEPRQIALMSRHVDASAMIDLLNTKLTASKA